MKEILRETKIHNFLRHFLLICYYMTVGMTVIELWRTNFPLFISFHHSSPCPYINWGMT
jgi:hypothetical protein